VTADRAVGLTGEFALAHAGGATRSIPCNYFAIVKKLPQSPRGGLGRGWSRRYCRQTRSRHREERGAVPQVARRMRIRLIVIASEGLRRRQQTQDPSTPLRLRSAMTLLWGELRPSRGAGRKGVWDGVQTTGPDRVALIRRSGGMSGLRRRLTSLPSEGRRWARGGWHTALIDHGLRRSDWRYMAMTSSARPASQCDRGGARGADRRGCGSRCGGVLGRAEGGVGREPRAGPGRVRRYERSR